MTKKIEPDKQFENKQTLDYDDDIQMCQEKCFLLGLILEQHVFSFSLYTKCVIDTGLPAICTISKLFGQKLFFLDIPILSKNIVYSSRKKPKTSREKQK
jgi:hypothetical protein